MYEVLGHILHAIDHELWSAGFAAIVVGMMGKGWLSVKMWRQDLRIWDERRKVNNPPPPPKNNNKKGRRR